MKKQEVCNLCKVKFELPRWYERRLRTVAPVYKPLEEECFITNYNALVTGEVDTIKFYSFTVEILKQVLLMGGKDSKPLTIILSLFRKYHFKDEVLVKHLLFIVLHALNWDRLQEVKNPSVNNVLSQLQFAYDALLHIEGYEDIEFRDTNGETSSRYMSPLGNRGRLEGLKYNVSLFRDMRLFLNHNTKWGSFYDKEILDLYYNEGLTLEEISRLYISPKTNKNKKARAETIYYKIKKYKKKMEEMKQTDPEVFCDGFEYLLQDKIDMEREVYGEA